MVGFMSVLILRICYHLFSFFFRLPVYGCDAWINFNAVHNVWWTNGSLSLSLRGAKSPTPAFYVIVVSNTHGTHWWNVEFSFEKNLLFLETPSVHRIECRQFMKSYSRVFIKVRDNETLREKATKSNSIIHLAVDSSYVLRNLSICISF